MSQSLREPLTVDCRGLQCPAPILRLSEAARQRKGLGGTLTVIATDTDFPMDLDAWCRSTKSKLLHIDREEDGVIRAEVRLPEPALDPAQALAPTERVGVLRAVDTRDNLEATIPSRDVRSGYGREPERSGLRDVTPGTLRGISSAAPSPRGSESASRPSSTRETRRDLPRPSRSAPSPEPASRPAPEPIRDVAFEAKVPDVSLEPQAETRESLSAPPPSVQVAAPRENKATLLVIRNDLEALLAALMVANASAAQGMSVEVFFSFWGIHLLRGRSTRAARGKDKPTLLQRILLWLTPKGPRQRLGKLDMGGIGTRILLRLMRKRNILALDKLVEAAAAQGVRFRVCSMSMGLMGMRESDIVDLPNIEFAGVTSFSESAARSAVALVF